MAEFDRQASDTVTVTDSVLSQVSQYTAGVPQTEQSWPLLAAPPSPPLPLSLPDDPGVDATVGSSFLGYGLVRPFRRDQQRDFVAAGGVALVRASVAQILGTMASGPVAQGELPWRPEFGSQLYRLRMGLNNAELAGIGRQFVADAITRWEPRVRITRVQFTRRSIGTDKGNILAIAVFFDILGSNPQNRQILGSTKAEVVIPGLATS